MDFYYKNIGLINTVNGYILFSFPSALSSVEDTSLNGSYGAKYSDGEIVLVKDFPGRYKILSSNHIVNNENVSTIFYKLQNTQTGQIHFVPQVFVIKE
ncbi:hypothetical protein [Persephonella sp.]